MSILKIDLNRFRNFSKTTLTFSPKTTVIVGPNGSGKTNVLESIFLLATGKSFKAKLEEEMVNYDAEIARINGEVVSSENSVNLEIVLTRGELRVGEDPVKIEKVPKKRLLVNGTPKRLIDFAGKLRVVVFGPWDLDLVTESPSIRRKFLDTVLSQVDREYRRAQSSYEKGLRQRNRLLWQIREDTSASFGTTRMRLLFWDKLLIKNGDYISTKREEFINFVNQTPPINEENFQIEYDRSAISEARLEQYAHEEVAAATTLVGPHRDDFIFKLETKDSKPKIDRELARFGSRGEARMGVLWLKMAELNFIEEETGEKPTLLLDDIFSELDDKHREVVMKVVKRQQDVSENNASGQVIITTADPHFIETLAHVDKIELAE